MDLGGGGCCPDGREQGLRRSVCPSHVHTVILDVHLAADTLPPRRQLSRSVVRKRSWWRNLAPAPPRLLFTFTLSARHALTIIADVGWGQGLAFHPQQTANPPSVLMMTSR